MRTRILIVDDNERVRESLRARVALSSNCFTVTSAAGGEEALELLGREHFDIVLCDLLLSGGMDGTEVTRRVSEEHPGTRVVVFSGNESGDRKVEVLHTGAFSYLSKPINHGELVHAIETINSIRRTEKLGAAFRSLAQISTRLQATFDFDRVAREVVRGACDLGYQRARLYLYDHERRNLVGKAVCGLAEGSFEGWEIPLTASPVIRAIFQTDKPKIWDKRRIVEHFGARGTEGWVSRLGLDELAWIDLPLMVGQDRIGTLAVDHDDPGRTYTEADLEIMGVFANLAAQALHNARMYEKEALANASLGSILRDAPDAVVTTDLQGVVNFVSPSTERVTGIPAEKMIGQPAARFYCDENGAPESGPPVARAIMRRLRQGGPVSNLRVHVTGKPPRPISLSGSLLRNERGEAIGTLGILKDLGALDAQAQHYRDVLEGFGHGTVLLGVAGAIRFINRKAERLLQQSRIEAEGRRLADLVLPSQRDDFLAAFRGVVGGGSEVVLDFSVVHPDDRRTSVKARMTAVRGRGRVTGVALALYDMNELGALIQSGRLMALGQMVAGLAHEVNNPLNNLVVAARELERRFDQDGALSDQARGYFEILERNSGRIGAIVAQLRELARPTEFRRVPLDLNRVVRDSLAFFGTRFRNRDIELEIDLADDLPPVLGDASRLQQVFVNLVVNAEEAMEDQTEPKKISISTRAAPPGGVRICVCDSGCGIPDEIRDAIFDPFFTTKAPNKGTGLGLSISRSIIDLHEGRIEATRPDARGTCFRIDLKAVREEER